MKTTVPPSLQRTIKRIYMRDALDAITRVDRMLTKYPQSRDALIQHFQREYNRTLFTKGSNRGNRT